MKAVIHFIFEEDEDNFIEDNQKLIDCEPKEFIITDKPNLPKSIYNKIEHIFYFNNKKICLKSVNQIINYLELFNYKQILLMNVNKKYNNDELIFTELSKVKEQFSVINSIL